MATVLRRRRPAIAVPLRYAQLFVIPLILFPLSAQGQTRNPYYELQCKMTGAYCDRVYETAPARPENYDEFLARKQHERAQRAQERADRESQEQARREQERLAREEQARQERLVQEQRQRDLAEQTRQARVAKEAERRKYEKQILVRVDNAPPIVRWFRDAFPAPQLIVATLILVVGGLARLDQHARSTPPSITFNILGATTLAALPISYTASATAQPWAYLSLSMLPATVLPGSGKSLRHNETQRSNLTGAPITPPRMVAAAGRLVLRDIIPATLLAAAAMFGLAFAYGYIFSQSPFEKLMVSGSLIGVIVASAVFADTTYWARAIKASYAATAAKEYMANRPNHPWSESDMSRLVQICCEMAEIGYRLSFALVMPIAFFYLLLSMSEMPGEASIFQQSQFSQFELALYVVDTTLRGALFYVMDHLDLAVTTLRAHSDNWQIFFTVLAYRLFVSYVIFRLLVNLFKTAWYSARRA